MNKTRSSQIYVTLTDSQIEELDNIRKLFPGELSRPKMLTILAMRNLKNIKADLQKGIFKLSDNNDWKE